MAADTRDCGHDSGLPLLATSQVPIINKLSLASSMRDPRKSEDGSPPDTYLWESADVHRGGGGTTKAKVPNSTSCTSQPPEPSQTDWKWKSFKELSEMDCGQLQRLCSKLSQLIRQRSIDLAPLLFIILLGIYFILFFTCIVVLATPSFLEHSSHFLNLVTCCN
uniref:Uncharacterized protein n=1 Tax=Amblyomma tuberculatum TaxID=48802 RepID=A0A6M2E434_9ACAR